MNHEVYICYDDKDIMTANAICHVLEENKMKCWFKKRDLGVDHMVEGMMDAIHQASLVVLIFSNHSKHSNFVNAEIDIAFTNEIPILVFKIDESKLDGGLEFFLNNKHWLDAYPDPEVKFESLIRDASKLLDKPVPKPIISTAPIPQEPEEKIEEHVEVKDDVNPVMDEPDEVKDKAEPVELEEEIVAAVGESTDEELKTVVTESIESPAKEDEKLPSVQKEAEKPQDDGNGGGKKNNLPLLIGIIAIAAIALIGGYFLLGGHGNIEYSVLVISDTAYMDVPDNPNATHSSDANGLHRYVDDDNAFNVTSCNSNISKKSAVTQLNEIKTSAENGANKIEEGNKVYYEKDGIYSIFAENKESKDMILIQSKDKDLLLQAYDSIVFHDAVDSLKVEDDKKIVNATKETKTAIKKSSQSSSSKSSSSSNSASASSSKSSSSSSSGAESHNWGSSSSKSSSSSGAESHSWSSGSKKSSSKKSSSSGAESHSW